MHEYVTVSSSSYDPASLATKLTEKAAEGWTVVAIVPTGGDVTAFLSRDGGAAAAASSSSSGSAGMYESASEPMMASAAPTNEPTVAMAAEAKAPTEPAGWAVAPEPAPAPAPAPVSSAPATVIQGAAPMADIGGGYNAPSAPTAPAYQPAPAPAPATPAVPAGWYADPAGRFDLRYWDGGTWTEHVSRAGQQFTDAPVA